jgi:hypothetical protein
MVYYALLDGNDVCYGVSTLSGRINTEGKHIVEIDRKEVSSGVEGKRWDGEKFSAD